MNLIFRPWNWWPVSDWYSLFGSWITLLQFLEENAHFCIGFQHCSCLASRWFSKGNLWRQLVMEKCRLAKRIWSHISQGMELPLWLRHTQFDEHMAADYRGFSAFPAFLNVQCFESRLFAFRLRRLPSQAAEEEEMLPAELLSSLQIFEDPVLSCA